jgi:hypothetical protein
MNTLLLLLYTRYMEKSGEESHVMMNSPPRVKTFIPFNYLVLFYVFLVKSFHRFPTLKAKITHSTLLSIT